MTLSEIIREQLMNEAPENHENYADERLRKMTVAELLEYISDVLTDRGIL